MIDFDEVPFSPAPVLYLGWQNGSIQRLLPETWPILPRGETAFGRLWATAKGRALQVN